MYYLLIVAQLEMLGNLCYLFAPNCPEKCSFPQVSKGSLNNKLPCFLLVPLCTTLMQSNPARAFIKPVSILQILPSFCFALTHLKESHSVRLVRIVFAIVDTDCI